MLLIIGYYLISGVGFYFIFRYISQQTDKINTKTALLFSFHSKFGNSFFALNF